MDTRKVARGAFWISAVLIVLSLFSLVAGVGVQEALVILRTWPFLMAPYAYIRAREWLADSETETETA